MTIIEGGNALLYTGPLHRHQFRWDWNRSTHTDRTKIKNGSRGNLILLHYNWICFLNSIAFSFSEILEAMWVLMQAWLMDDSNEDQRLPHHPNPKELLPMDYLAGSSLAPTYSYFFLNKFWAVLLLLYWICD